MALSRAMLIVSSRSLVRPLVLSCRLKAVESVYLQNVAKTSFVLNHPFRFYSEKKVPSLTSVLSPSTGTQTPEESESEKEEARKKAIKNNVVYPLIAIFSALGIGFLFILVEYGPPRTDEQGAVIPDEYSSQPAFLAYLNRTKDVIWKWKKECAEPSRDKLLPDPLKYPYYQPPYTVLVELNGLLTLPQWNIKTGWRFKKRQFVDYFIQACGYPNAELVLFSDESGHIVEPIIDSLDRQGSIIYRLYRDSTLFENGRRIKDLNRLNRPLNKVIHIDFDGETCRLNPNNCLILKKWDGNDDKTLFDLTNFIKAIITQDVPDVRDVLSYYRQFDDPLEAFKERQRQLAENENQLKESVVKKSKFGFNLNKPKVN